MGGRVGGGGRRWAGSCRLGRFGKVEHDDVMHFRVYTITSPLGREPATRLLSRLSGGLGWADVDWEVRKFGRTRWGAEGGRRQVGWLGRLGKG